MADNSNVPTFIYGTAWKEDKTEALVKQALDAGFRAIDTANQRKHYYEEGVGKAIQGFPRKELFLQTKFTFARGQDHRMPYDEKQPYAVQVQQSFESSLEHLGTDYVDSLVLHGPFTGRGIVEQDLEVWSAMEKLCNENKVRELGVSNVSQNQLSLLYTAAKIKPRFVQNRCFADQLWDLNVREFCREHKIYYQGFSLLTANQAELNHPKIRLMAEKYKKTIPQIVFRFSKQVGMIPLTGSSNRKHLDQDLDIDDFKLEPGEMKLIEEISNQGAQ
jgi:diketogulonate reductase-like aldo/keto reductase